MSRGSRLETVASEGRLHEDGARQAQRTSVSEHPGTVGRCHAQAQYLCKASLVATARRENVTIAARPTRADDTGCLHLLDHARRTVVADLQAALHPRYRGLARRSEEHTSELQSLMRISYAVFCLKK